MLKAFSAETPTGLVRGWTEPGPEADNPRPALEPELLSHKAGPCCFQSAAPPAGTKQGE